MQTSSSSNNTPSPHYICIVFFSRTVLFSLCTPFFDIVMGHLGDQCNSRFLILTTPRVIIIPTPPHSFCTHTAVSSLPRWSRRCSRSPSFVVRRFTDAFLKPSPERSSMLSTAIVDTNNRTLRTWTSCIRHPKKGGGEGRRKKEELTRDEAKWSGSAPRTGTVHCLRHPSLGSTLSLYSIAGSSNSLAVRPLAPSTRSRNVRGGGAVW